MAERSDNHHPAKPHTFADSIDRRSFLGVLLGVVTASVTAFLSIPLVRFAIYPIVEKTTETLWSPIGVAAELTREAAGAGGVTKRIIRVEQRDGWRKIVSDKAIYLVADAAGGLRALSPICPHLGCPVTWQKAKNQFVCPCHGGVFASNGTYVSGPPPRAMDELETKIEHGQILVRYQYFRSLVPTKELMS